MRVTSSYVTCASFAAVSVICISSLIIGGEWYIIIAEVIIIDNIKVLQPQKAAAFLAGRLERLGRDENEYISKLAERLGYHLLALEQAAAYIQVTGISCQAYLGLLEKHGLRATDQSGAQDHGFSTILSATMQISFKKIKLKSAKQLLCLCAYFAPEGIPLSMLIHGRDDCPGSLRKALTNEAKLDAAIFELTKYSLLRRQGKLLYIDPLLQEVVCDKLAQNPLWVCRCLYIASNALDFEVLNLERKDTQLKTSFPQNMRHIITIANHVEAKLGDYASVKKKRAWLYQMIGLWYYISGQLENALEYFEKALAILGEVLGRDHHETANNNNYIALIYADQGRYLLALELYRKNYPILLHELGDAHQYIIEMKNAMKATYNKAGLAEPFEQWLENEFGD